MKQFNYKAFDGENAIGNPAAVFLIEEECLSFEDKSVLARKANLPISCFVEVLGDKANIEFFAPNGEGEGICFHGTMAVIKMLKDNFENKVKKIEIKNYQEIEFLKFENDFYGIKFPNKTEIKKIENQDLLTEIKENFNFEKNDIKGIYLNELTRDILIETSSADLIDNLSFEINASKELIKKYKSRAIMLFSLVDEKSIKSRILYINLNELEDICCGSANISISKILLEKYNIKEYENVQPYHYKETQKVGGLQKVISLEEKTILTGHVSQF